MAGKPYTQQFNFSEATLMVGPMEDVMNLTPKDHSLGLVKNISITYEREKADLTYGTQNSVAYTVRTGSTATVTTEVYEYGKKNIAYAAGLDASSYTRDKNNSYSIAVSVTGDGSTTDTVVLSSATDISSEFSSGDTIILQSRTEDDLRYIGEVDSVIYSGAYYELTVNLKEPIPEGFDFDAGDIAKKSSIIEVRDNDPMVFYGMKVAVSFPELDVSPTVIFPKVAITNGFNLGAVTGEYSNLPMEFQALNVVPTDPHASEFESRVFRYYS